MNWGEPAMTSKTSLFNKGLIYSAFKRWRWFSVLYTLALFFLLPFNHLLSLSNLQDEWIKNNLLDSLDIWSNDGSLQAVLVCTLPIILAALIFHYLNSHKATTMMHSLPLKRKTLFYSHSLAGLCLLLGPVLLISLLLIVLNLTTSLNQAYSVLHILQWIGFNILFSSLFFFITTFVGMFTGNTLAQLAFTYILNILPAGLYVLIFHNLDQLLYGFCSAQLSESWMANLPMFALVAQPGYGFLTPGKIVVYLLLTVFFFFSTAYLYQKRSLESAGEVISFSIIRPLFKYGVTFCTMLLGGSLFSSIYYDSWPLLLLGYLVGSLIGYWVAEVLLQKSFRVWASLRKGYWKYAAVIVLLLMGINVDVTGYIQRVPTPAHVENIFFGTSIYPWLNNAENSVTRLSPEGEIIETDTYYDGLSIFDNKENIQNIISLHEQLVTGPAEPEEGRYYYFAYTLTNGKHLVRQYKIDEEALARYMAPIYESLEYKEARFPLLTQNPSDFKLMEIQDERTNKKPLLLTNSTEIEEFCTLFKQELLDTPFTDLVYSTRDYISVVTIDHHDRKTEYALRRNYQDVFQWLKTKNYYHDVLMNPDDIAYAIVINPHLIDDKYDNDEVVFTEQIGITTSEKEVIREKHVKITDKEIIGELIALTITRTYSSPRRYIEYDVNFYSTNQEEKYNRLSLRISPDLSAPTASPFTSVGISESLKGYLQQIN